MATNSKHEHKEQSTSTRKGKSNTMKWEAGMPCRAIYEEDGLEYEAFVVEIINDDEGIVKFLGYDNSEMVKMKTLKPSQGKVAQKRQIQQAAADVCAESDSSTQVEDQTKNTESDSSTQVEEETAGARSSQGNTERTSRKKESRKRKSQTFNNFQFPNMPNFDNLPSMDPPYVPPPLSFLTGENVQCKEHAVSSMLLSWYMSGYYTGLYQAFKRSKPNKHKG